MFLQDYNFQAQHYGAFSSNHAQLAEPFYPVITKALPIGRRRAAYPDWGERVEGHSGPAGMISSNFQNGRHGMGNYSGVELPSHVTAYGGYYFGDLGTRGLIGWVALVFVDRYDYSGNVTFLREVTYPLLLEGADFFESYLTYSVDPKTGGGRYDLENACAWAPAIWGMQTFVPSGPRNSNGVHHAAVFCHKNHAPL